MQRQIYNTDFQITTEQWRAVTSESGNAIGMPTH